MKEYCYLKYSCSFDFQENPSLNKTREKYISDYSYDEFYVEEYNDFEALKNRINVIYNQIVKNYEDQNMNIYNDECSFPEFVICNRYQECLTIGVSSSGWNISMTFFDYLIKYFENNYGKEEGQKKYSQLTKENEVFFYTDVHSEPTVIPACDLVSQKTAYIILKEFLDTGKTEWDLDPDIFYQEISKRNY